MKRLFRIAKRVIKDSVQRFSAADPIVYSAAIAFFTLFSLPPILFIVVKVGGSLVGTARIAEEVYLQVREKVGEESARQMQTILESGFAEGEGIFSQTLSFLILLFAATVVFSFIKKALNSIWNVKPKPKQGITKFAIDRAFSLILIIILGIFIVASLLLDSLIALFADEFSDELLGLTPYVVKMLNNIASFLLMTVVFTLLYKYFPDIRSPWRPMWVGGLITSGLFTLGKFIIGSIISGTDISTTYGAAGSLAAILLWVFYSSVTVLIGAIITKIYYLHKGYQVHPTEHAVAIEIREIEWEEEGEQAPPLPDEEEEARQA
ncbi:YihY/virulence factor BrkB family protein [Cesiribacter andamanensis]|uniref:YihY/virulence factor BrkB family protein n=1 Tax=Cesiribacter andamanensis AMV16 TaxID=1279009 RepID=M7N092_9BACT|nr:YihY/virulence factor BrkB family protein [Cesiribacter andamanensis]EMR00641.1 ribonuclease BN/unknown domain fusion protein [Cesiribacter andamanensis AMV16]